MVQCVVLLFERSTEQSNGATNYQIMCSCIISIGAQREGGGSVEGPFLANKGGDVREGGWEMKDSVGRFDQSIN